MHSCWIKVLISFFFILPKIMKGCASQLKILSSTTVVNIDNTNKCFLSNKIKMISEGSCDTEDWSNDANNWALQ